MNVFPNAFPVLYPTPSIGVDIGNAHNLFLQTALDLGLPGLIGYTLVWIGSFVMLARSLRRAKEAGLSQLERAALIGLGGAFLGYLVWGITDAVPPGTPPEFLWWAELGLVASAYLRSTRMRRQTTG